MFMKFRIPIIACFVSNLICTLMIVVNKGHYRASVEYAMMFSLLILLIFLVYYIAVWICKEKNGRNRMFKHIWNYIDVFGADTHTICNLNAYDSGWQISK